MVNYDDSVEEQQWKKEKNKGEKNNSTLSLHISTYENSIEENVEQDDEYSGVKKENSAIIKVFCSLNAFQNPFEFPRQGENDTVQPEIMQFRASQWLTNPNDSNRTTSNPQNESVLDQNVQQNHQNEIDQMDDEDEEEEEEDSFLYSNYYERMTAINRQKKRAAKNCLAGGFAGRDGAANDGAIEGGRHDETVGGFAGRVGTTKATKSSDAGRGRRRGRGRGLDHSFFTFFFTGINK
uniref:Uncharacterized protein n=1 Tax=Panagrolaimus sp. ES5 TaxID=591445 RepID=A0AC34GPT3_9BILA